MLVISGAYIRGAYIRGGGAHIRGAYIRNFTVSLLENTLGMS